MAEVAVAVVIAGLLAAAFTAMGYYMQASSNQLKIQNSKTILDVVRSRLLYLAKDVDDDSFFELLAAKDNSTVPMQAGIATDAWGQPIVYTEKDFGTANSVDHNYSFSTDAISPDPNVQGRLVSKGIDGILQTTASDINASGDDIMVEIGVGELNHFKLYGGSEIQTQTRNYNSAIVSDDAPSDPNTGTLWYESDTDTMYIYKAGTWQTL